jgi:pimeloyl-ACP methyl ester carboxylesterase
MSTFVIVHGAWGGGWEWSPVADILRAGGHRVFTPTLSGMGERAHLAAREPVGLSTHIADIVTVLQFEQLADVVLCGASYGGMPVTGAADQAPDRVRLLVYVDALVPLDGRCALDLLPQEFAATVRTGLAAHGVMWNVPMPPALLDALIPNGSVPEAVRQAYRERVRNHPAAAFAEPIRLSGAVDGIPKAFVHCTVKDDLQDVGGDPIAAGAARARREGWIYRSLPVPHDPQVFDPAGIARALTQLTEVARRWPSSP